MARGKAPYISDANKHEIRRYREAGASIERLALMWKVGKRRILQILAEQRLKFGPEQLPPERRHLVRRRNFTSEIRGHSEVAR